MINNDILKRIRYTFDYKDDKMIALFKHTGFDVSRAEISNWLKKEEDPDFVKLNDRFLSIFLNGLIIEKRGKMDDKDPIIESELTNNIILRKLKIALNLKDDDILEMMQHVDFNLSRHELSAFFRKPDHKHYRTCKDQILRNFTFAIQAKFGTKTNAE